MYFYYETKFLFPISKQHFELINLRPKISFIQEGNYHDSIPEQKPPSQSNTLAPAAPSTQPTHEQLSDDSRLEKQSSPNKVETALPTSGSQTVPEESVSSSKTPHSQRTSKQQNSPQHQTEVTPTSDKSASKTSTSEGSSITQDAPKKSSVAKASSPPPPSPLPTPSQASQDRVSIPSKPPATDTHVNESIALPTQGKIA